MKDKRRALTLTIDANSASDMQMLLKQALYEIDQLLPLPADTGSEKVARAAAKAIFDNTPESGRETRRHTQGSIGSYEFSFLHSSREFKALEDQLLEEGYKLEKNIDMFFSEKYFYVHHSLPAKIITGEPLAIEDKPASTEDKPF